MIPTHNTHILVSTKQLTESHTCTNPDRVHVPQPDKINVHLLLALIECIAFLSLGVTCHVHITYICVVVNNGIHVHDMYTYHTN